ncbi:MAG: hypothetical protein M3P49_09865, partial [Actinomycetota bacterium]|nr:hypothetical protein [Actinomycetota bacterium]
MDLLDFGYGNAPAPQALPERYYRSDITDEEWAFVAPYLSLMRPDAPQRTYDPREVYNALRWIVRT